ncbi:MAG: hypothetical protein SFW63_00290 [Alphaproteobacteria bacterium]|nr:hypothetical protein [Alphaproteobacteria bacterium]
MTSNFNEKTLQTSLREHFGKYIANNCSDDKIKLLHGDIIVVDYFDRTLPPDQLHAQISSTVESLEKADFPGSANLALLQSNTTQPVLIFKGREVLEMLYQFGVRFAGDSAYSTETTLAGNNVERLQRLR